MTDNFPEVTGDIGRPTKYDPESHPRLARAMCELGAIDTEIAAAFDIAVSTLYLWKAKHPEFSESLRVGKEPADERVKRSLYARAIGYSHPEDDIRTVSLGGDRGSEIVITPTIKHYPPDPTSGIFWLKNRCKKEFGVDPDEKPTNDLAAALMALIESRPN